MLNPQTSFYRFSLFTILLLTAVVAPFASSAPDGLEQVARTLHFEESAHTNPPIFPPSQAWANYEVKGLPPRLGTALAGVGGVIITFASAWGLGKGLTLLQKSTQNSPKG